MEKQIEEMERIIQKCDDEAMYASIAYELYNAGYRKQEWISINDKLPERNGRYLTHCCVGGRSLVCILYYNKYYGFDEDTVTHWMPLPEPPKMKGGVE